MSATRTFVRLLCSVALAVSVAGDVLAQEVDFDRLELMHHSFESPLSYDATFPDWSFNGASVATKSGVILVPGVADRNGIFWHRRPIQTDIYEIFFTFRLTYDTNEENRGAGSGFAFWLLADEPAVPPSNDPVAVRQDWPLFGYKSDFKGLGVFFATQDRDGVHRGSISATVNDGTHAVNPVTGIPTSNGVYVNSFHQSEEQVKFRVTVNKSTVTGALADAARPDGWLEAFRIPVDNFLSNARLAFTSSTPEDSSLVYQKVAIEGLHVYNLDLSRPGEESDVIANDQDVKELLSNPHNSENFSEVASELRHLSQILFKQISEQQPRENSILRHIVSLQMTVEQMTSQLRELEIKVDAVSTGQKPGEVVHQVTNELQGLRSLFHSHSKNQADLQQSLSSLEKSMSNPSEFVERSAALEATIKQQATFSSWMIFGVIVMIALFALFMWKRMRDMEKKHFL